jgi:hypothetical protein
MARKSRQTFQKSEKERAKREKREGKIQKKINRRSEAREKKSSGEIDEGPV